MALRTAPAASTMAVAAPTTAALGVVGITLTLTLFFASFGLDAGGPPAHPEPTTIATPSTTASPSPTPTPTPTPPAVAVAERRADASDHAGSHADADASAGGRAARLRLPRRAHAAPWVR